VGHLGDLLLHNSLYVTLPSTDLKYVPPFCGGVMKRFALATLLFTTLLSAGAFANTIIYFSPNDGSGDNFGFVQYGPGYNITGFGGVAYSFFNCCDGFAPGSTFGGSTDLFLSSGFAKIGPLSSEVQYLAGAQLFVSTIIFPTNGQNFRPLVDIDFSGSGLLLDFWPQTIDVGGSARGYIEFSFINGAYYPSAFEQIPEPGTLGLIATGVIGVLAKAKKWRRAASYRRS
jgi:hypothetical protein